MDSEKNQPIDPRLHYAVKQGYHESFLAFHRVKVTGKGFTNAKNAGAAHNTSTLTQAKHSSAQKSPDSKKFEKARLCFRS